ncbi:MAG: Wzz/FepE/Etk N-terminal domain-containing protein [Bacilli bacterium]|jgi:capsular polysaccharide biosynthesis protein|nr:Wzz/FepE/Etk N-terminal domain-containing protein [Bacilli bacterium]
MANEKKEKEGMPLETETTIAKENPLPNQEDNGRTFADYWHMIIKHWIGVLLIIFVFVIGGFVYAKAIKKPKWQAEGQALVYISDDTTGTNSLTQAQIISNSKTLLISTVSFMNSTPVYQAVLQDVVDSKETYTTGYTLSDLDKIKKLVSSSPENYTSVEQSLVIDVFANTPTKEFSVFLVNSVLTHATDIAQNDPTLSKVFKDVIKVFSTPNVTDCVDSSTKTLTILLASGLIGLVLAIAYAIIRELNNVYVTSKKELELLTGYKVIGLIPDYSKSKEGK